MKDKRIEEVRQQLIESFRIPECEDENGNDRKQATHIVDKIIKEFQPIITALNEVEREIQEHIQKEMEANERYRLLQVKLYSGKIEDYFDAAIGSWKRDIARLAVANERIAELEQQLADRVRVYRELDRKSTRLN